MYGQNPEITKKELVEISASLIRIGSKLIKNSNVEKLIALSQKENDSDVQSLALMRLFATVPSDKRVILALQKIIDNNQSPQLMGMSISHLAALRSPWLSERLDKYSRHQKDLVRLASISAIHFVCPKDHWNLLKGRLASETNPGILKAILHESSFIGGPKARDFLDGVINEKKLGNDYVVIAKVELEKLSQDSISHCR